MSRVSKFTPSEQQFLHLTAATIAFRAAELEGFASDLTKGKILFESQLNLGFTKGAEVFWSKWVRNDVVIPIRTAYRYCTVYKHFFGERLPDFPEMNPAYLQSVGFTKLDLAITINNHLRNGEVLDDVQEIEFLADGITLQIKSDDGIIKTPLEQLSAATLRTYTPTRSYGKKSGSTQATPSSVLDPDSIADIEELRKLVESEKLLRKKAEKKIVALEKSLAELKNEPAELRVKLFDVTNERDELKAKLEEFCEALADNASSLGVQNAA